MSNNELGSLDRSLLANVYGGKKDKDDDEPRTTRQLIADYGKACTGGAVMGGAVSTIAKTALGRTKAIVGICALGMLGQGIEDGFDWWAKPPPKGESGDKQG